MRKGAGLWMAGLIALSSGCGLGVHGPPSLPERRDPIATSADRARCQKLADYAWHIFRKAHPGAEFTTDYSTGFKEGFVEGLDTGENAVVAVSAARSPEHSAGFRQGAEAASREGRAQQAQQPRPPVETLPTMLPDRVSVPRESVEPPLRPRPDPAALAAVHRLMAAREVRPRPGQDSPYASVMRPKRPPFESGENAKPEPQSAPKAEEILILPEFRIGSKEPAPVLPVAAEEEKPAEGPDLFVWPSESPPEVSEPVPLTTCSTELEDDTEETAIAVEKPAVMGLPGASAAPWQPCPAVAVPPSVPADPHPRSVVPAGTYAPLPPETERGSRIENRGLKLDPWLARRGMDLPVTAPLVVTPPPEVRLGPAVAPAYRPR
ncbi:MAG: hypothetical protein L0Z62_17345 [Gemmataceae bacterium]|nr:hypothetical protein [Gemmataceae bacterium]